MKKKYANETMLRRNSEAMWMQHKQSNDTEY